ncbi:MAG TPA: TfoX/Sxy family protein [Mycobacteriales bacterium]|nr:TfoX/Sxy family protein [Mycobacteriales bacterium]
MTYDSELADRIRELLGPETGTSERRMFGGLAFLIGGHMAVAASREGGLMVRVDPEQTAGLLTRAHVEPFRMRGRELTGWLRVEAPGLRTRRQLQSWVERGVAFARSLPPKASAS